MELKRCLDELLSGQRGGCPPRFEGEFAPETVERWRNEGHLDERSPEAFFNLLQAVELDLPWRRLPKEAQPLTDSTALEALRRAYDLDAPGRFPEGWRDMAASVRANGGVPYFAPWNEGFFQIIGIGNGASLSTVLSTLCERPALAEAAMEHYASFVEGFLDRVLPVLKPDFVLLYEPIACNHGPIIGPGTYRHFVLPALTRVNTCLERHGIRFRVLWSTGAVQEFFPLWCETGVTAFNIEEGPQSGITYTGLRKRIGNEHVLMGGIDWRMVAAGPEAIDRMLEKEIRPLLEAGRYIPHLNDSVRAYLPFEHFAYYRRRLDALLDRVFG